MKRKYPVLTLLFLVLAFSCFKPVNYAGLNAEMPRPKPIINVKDCGATGNGLTNDAGAILNAMKQIINAGQGTLFFPAGNYRWTDGGDAMAFNKNSNVTINFDPGAVLLMDNLNSDGSGNGHGVVFRGAGSNIWLQNVHVKWKTLPSSRSYGDGIRFDGYPSDALCISDIHIMNCTVEQAPQAGLIVMGCSDVTVKNSHTLNTLADALHFNTCRRVNVDTHFAEQTSLLGTREGDDGLAFVTYYHPSSVYAYPGATEGPYAQPGITEWCNFNSMAKNIRKTGGIANGCRISMGNKVTVSNLTVDGAGGDIFCGLQSDAAISNPSGTIGWTYWASKGVKVDHLTATNVENGFCSRFISDANPNDLNYRGFDLQVTDITVNNCSRYGVLLQHVNNVTVTEINGTSSGSLVQTDCQNCSINPH